MVVKDYKLYNSVQGNCIFFNLHTIRRCINNIDNPKSKLINIFYDNITSGIANFYTYNIRFDIEF